MSANCETASFSYVSRMSSQSAMLLPRAPYSENARDSDSTSDSSPLFVLQVTPKDTVQGRKLIQPKLHADVCIKIELLEATIVTDRE